MRIVMLLVLLGCGKSDSTTSSGTAGRASMDKLKVTIDGKPIAMAHAYIKRLPAGRHQLYVTDGSSSCRELLDNVFDSKAGKQTLLFNLGNRLAPDGKLTNLVTDLFIRGSGEVNPDSKASVTGSTDAGGRAEVALDFSGTGEGRKYEVHGTLTAEGCGADEVGTDGHPKAKHPSAAKVTVAGKPLPLVSAIRKGKEQPWVIGAPPTRDLVLSTGPLDCSGTTPWAEVILERSGGSWRMHGEWLGKTVQNNSMIDKTGQPETKDLAVTPGAKGTGADGATIELELAGKGSIDGYPITLEGKLEAIDCPE